MSLLWNFTLQEDRMTVKLSIGWIQSNSKLVAAKHWTYQTLSECIHACVMILPIKEYKLLNHKNYNFLACDWFKKGLFSTNSLAKLLSDSLLLDSLLLDSLLSDSSNSQSHSKM